MEMFAMAEYGSFVWSSYLLMLVVVVASTIQAKRRHCQITAGITRQLKAEENSELNPGNSVCWQSGSWQRKLL